MSSLVLKFLVLALAYNLPILIILTNESDAAPKTLRLECTAVSQELVAALSDDEIKEKICTNIPPERLHDISYFRFDNVTGKCYDPRYDNPCPQEMKFYGQPDNAIYGACDCKREVARTLIYHKDTNQCYFIFKQAYCPEGQWLTFSRMNGQPICEPNPCAFRQTATSKDFVLFNNCCVELDSDAPESNPGKIFVTFRENKIFARCGDYSYGGLGTVDPNKEPCTPGTERSVSGKCQPDFNW